MKRDTGEIGNTVVLSCGLSLFFLFLELLKVHRSSQWSGILPGDWAGLVLAVSIYAISIALLIVLGRFIVARVYPASRMQPWWLGVLLSLAGGTVWGLLSVHREFTPTLDDALVGAVLVGTGGALALVCGRGWLTVRRFAGLLVFSWLAACSALGAAGEYFLFSPDRAQSVTVYPAIWLAVSGSLLLVVVLWRPGRFLLPAGVLAAAAPPILVAWSLHAPAPASGARPPNLVFLVADTLRADYCSVYGGQVPTPNLERLAARGARFDRHYALSPWTLPSMTGLFSSQYPKSLSPDAGHEIWTLQMNQYEVDYESPTFPMLVEEAGYTTGAFTANAFLPVIPGMMFGYRDRASSHPILLHDEGLFRQLPFLGALVRAWCRPLANIRPHNTTRDLDHYARAFIRRHRNVPFFLWIHYIDPHAPYDPPPSMRRVQDGPWPFFHPYVGGEAWGIPILGKNFAVEPADRDYVQSLYEGEVAYIDQFTGRIMDALEEANVAGETYFCFTSDHGEELWDHGQWGHGQSLHDELTRVPLIVAGPDVAARVEPAPVSAIDVVPTLADLLGLTPSSEWRGQSLRPVLRGDKDVSTEAPVFAGGTSNKAVNPMHMVVLGRYKLIRTAGSEEVALFDLEADPGEQRNVAAEHPDRVATMEQLLERWFESYPRYFEADPEQLPEFNWELEQGLGGMGYL